MEGEGGTMTDVSELQGQALREAIAVAKGWRLQDGYWHTPEGRDVYPQYMPRWDISLQAAFGLIAGLDYQINGTQGRDPFITIFTMQPTSKYIDTTKDYCGTAATLPLAICYAWLAMKQAQDAEVAT
jgi:hypothetical protein